MMERKVIAVISMGLQGIEILGTDGEEITWRWADETVEHTSEIEYDVENDEPYFTDGINDGYKFWLSEAIRV